jgi:hypothetical protein
MLDSPEHEDGDEVATSSFQASLHKLRGVYKQICRLNENLAPVCSLPLQESLSLFKVRPGETFVYQSLK